MTCKSRNTHRLVALVVWMLAATAAAGTSTPRLRAFGRERVARPGIARAGGPRADDARSWGTPELEHDPDHTVADGLVGPARIDAAGDDAASGGWALAPGPAWAAVAAVVTDRASHGCRGARWLARSSAGRGPPLA